MNHLQSLTPSVQKTDPIPTHERYNMVFRVGVFPMASYIHRVTILQTQHPGEPIPDYYQHVAELKGNVPYDVHPEVYRQYLVAHKARPADKTDPTIQNIHTLVAERSRAYMIDALKQLLMRRDDGLGVATGYRNITKFSVDAEGVVRPIKPTTQTPDHSLFFNMLNACLEEVFPVFPFLENTNIDVPAPLILSNITGAPNINTERMFKQMITYASELSFRSIVPESPQTEPKH